MSYDRALTVFSPDGHLFQVEYAMEAVRKGYAIAGVVAKDCIVLAYEKKATAQLQDPRTVKKLLAIDENISFLFAGLNADAHKLIDMARVEAQSFRLSYDEIPSISYIAKYIGRQQQIYTQRGGRRPFGVSAFICGVDSTGPRLFQTDPAGICTEWKANASGKSDKAIRTFLENHYTEGLEEDKAIELIIEAMLEAVSVVEKTVDIAIIKQNTEPIILPRERIETLVKEIKERKEEEEEQKQKEKEEEEGME
ncbi:hypothetical protein WA158_001721 [Blastocystis sp. Blastoise]